MENNVMTAKEYLQQYADAARVVRRLRIEYEEELDLIDNIHSPLSGDGTPRTGAISKSVENKAIRLADKALALKDAELEAIRIRQEVFDVINKIPGEAGEVLYLRYVQLKTWGEISDAVGYSKRHIGRLHAEGLAQVQKCPFMSSHDVIF